MTSSSHYRKVHALVANIDANGCNAGKAASALDSASRIVEQHELDPSRVDWPAAPAGYRIVGVLGRGGRVEKEEAPEIGAQTKAKSPSSRKKPMRHHQPGEPTRPERMLELLRRPEGVSLDELVEALDIQPHSARALISVRARKIAGLTVKVVDGRYHIIEDA